MVILGVCGKSLVGKYGDCKGIGPSTEPFGTHLRHTFSKMDDVPTFKLFHLEYSTREIKFQDLVKSNLIL